MTAAFAPAEQLAFRPRTIADVEVVTDVEPVERLLAAVPEWDGPPTPAGPDGGASVHVLPVVHLDEVYRRRRLVAVVVVSADEANVWVDTVTVVVQPGDTAGAIAARLDADADPQVLVPQLTGLAGSAALNPGQVLHVPVAWLE